MNVIIYVSVILLQGMTYFPGIALILKPRDSILVRLLRNDVKNTRNLENNPLLLHL